MLWLLASLPIVHFFLLYAFSDIPMRRNLTRMYVIAYLDWLFVPFNLLIPLGVELSWDLFGVFIVAAAGITIVLHQRWGTIRDKPAETAIFFRDRKLTAKGWVHAAFMVLQAALALTVFFSTPISPYYLVMLALLLIYCLAYVLIVRYVRHVRIMSKAEMPFVLAGAIALIVRMLLVA